MPGKMHDSVHRRQKAEPRGLSLRAPEVARDVRGEAANSRRSSQLWASRSRPLRVVQDDSCGLMPCAPAEARDEANCERVLVRCSLCSPFSARTHQGGPSSGGTLGLAGPCGALGAAASGRPPSPGVATARVLAQGYGNGPDVPTVELESSPKHEAGSCHVPVAGSREARRGDWRPRCLEMAGSLRGTTLRLR